MSPECRGASGSERKSPNAQSANTARVLQVFCPLSTQPPSTLVAVLRMAARSLPAPGSDQACDQMSSPQAIRGRSRFCCSSVPNSKMVGASRKMPFCPTRRGAPTR